MSVGAVGERIKKRNIHRPSSVLIRSLPCQSLPLPSLQGFLNPFSHPLNDAGKIITLFFKDSASHIPISFCVGPTLILLLLGADKGGAIEREGANERENCGEVTSDERMKVVAGGRGETPALPHSCSPESPRFEEEPQGQIMFYRQIFTKKNTSASFFIFFSLAAHIVVFAG